LEKRPAAKPRACLKSVNTRRTLDKQKALKNLAVERKDVAKVWAFIAVVRAE